MRAHIQKLQEFIQRLVHRSSRRSSVSSNASSIKANVSTTSLGSSNSSNRFSSSSWEVIIGGGATCSTGFDGVGEGVITGANGRLTATDGGGCGLEGRGR